MPGPSKVVLLVGHGGIPKDCPAELISELKREEAKAAGKPSPKLSELDSRLRRWPRTPESDPYKPGLEAVAAALAAELPAHRVLTAYNEFCAPSLEEAFESAVLGGAQDITVISTMYTRGGVHSEKEIPALLESLRRKHPTIAARYVWPFQLSAVSSFLASEVRRAGSEVLSAQ